MAFDTRLGTRGKPSKRAPSRIAPTSRRGGETPTARGMQARARTSTLASLASGGSTHAAAALSRRTTKIERAQNVLRKAQLASAAPGLDSEQNHVLSQVLHSGQHSHASKQALLSAVETGLVESDLKNLPGGDADSAGWRQERASIYPNPTNVKASAGRYFSEAKAAGPHASAGQLAADVQRPAEQYRGRYDEVQGRAEAILKSARAKKVPPPKLAKAKLALTKLGASARPTKGPAGPSPFKKAAKASGYSGKNVMKDPGWDPGTDELNRGINPIVKAWAKKYGATLNAGYDPGGGHVSPGHNVTGTATDVQPAAGWTPAATHRFEQGLRVLSNSGFDVLYGTDGIGHAYPNHGRGNHAHIEWATVGSMSAGSSAALQKLGGLSASQVKKIQNTVGPGSSGSASGAVSSAVSTYASSTGQSKGQASKTLAKMSTKQRFAALYKALRSSGSALGAGGTTGVGGSARSTTPTPTRRYSAPARSARLGLS